MQINSEASLDLGSAALGNGHCNIEILQKFQSKIVGRITNAINYDTNDQLHRSDSN